MERIGENQKLCLEAIRAAGGALHTNGLLKATNYKIASTAKRLAQRGLLKHVEIREDGYYTFSRISAKEMRAVEKIRKEYPRATSVWVIPSLRMRNEVTTPDRAISSEPGLQTRYRIPFDWNETGA